MKVVPLHKPRIRLQRSFDGAFLNRVVNDDSVFPNVSLGLPRPLDLTAIVADPRNVFLANDYGGFLMVAVDAESTIYDVHTQFLPEGRGRNALKAARWAKWYMFTQTPALRLDTTVACDNKAAAWFTRTVGFGELGDIAVCGVRSHYYVLTLKMWARSLECQQQQ